MLCSQAPISLRLEHEMRQFFSRYPNGDNFAAHIVKKPDGSRPETSTVRKAVKSFAKAKSKRGRATGWRKTTPEEDAIILRLFRKLRPPGHGITAPEVHRALPTTLRRKLCAETVRLRLTALG